MVDRYVFREQRWSTVVGQPVEGERLQPQCDRAVEGAGNKQTHSWMLGCELLGLLSTMIYCRLLRL